MHIFAYFCWKFTQFVQTKHTCCDLFSGHETIGIEEKGILEKCLEKPYNLGFKVLKRSEVSMKRNFMLLYMLLIAFQRMFKITI